MVSDKHVIRRVILSKLYDLLQDEFADCYSRDTFVRSDLPMHELDGLLAFKSGANLEELRHTLDRLEEDSFGLCISCKSSIGQHLLDSDPTRRVCSSCEDKLVHFNSLHSYHRHQMA